MDYTFELLKLEDLDELCSLIKIVFKRDSEYVIEKTRWAFDNSHSCVMVAKHNGEIVASRGGFNWPLKINGMQINAIQFHGTNFITNQILWWCKAPHYPRRHNHELLL